MELPPDVVGPLVVAALVLAAVALAVALVALTGQRRVARTYARFSGGRDGDVLELLDRYAADVQALRDDVSALGGYTGEVRELLRSSMSRLGTVRYDAFDDMGGRLSFSTALLDEHGDGLVLTSINGRSETRVYAKPLVGGDCEHVLSDDERMAVEEALSMRQRTAAGAAGSNGHRRGRRRGRVRA